MNARRPNTYSVGQLAKLAGVTVRTLHIWDEAGLLKPERTEWSQHRRYQQRDLLRLGQIMTLKHLGFTLSEIRDLLESPDIDLKDALRAQKAAVDREIGRLQIASYALARTIKALDEDSAPDWDQVAALIQSFAEIDRQALINDYYPPEQWAWVNERANQMPPEFVQSSAEAWERVYDGFRAIRHLPPESPEAQALAADMARLIDLFTRGDPAVEASIKRLYQEGQIQQQPFHPARGDDDLQSFMQEALAAYRKAHA